MAPWLTRRLPAPWGDGRTSAYWTEEELALIPAQRSLAGTSLHFAVSIGQVRLHLRFAGRLMLFVKCLGFDKTEKILAKPLSPSFLSPCGFDGELTPYVSDSFALNSSKPYFRKAI